MDENKLKGLSKKAKLELLDALEAKRQRAISKGTAYTPNSGQIQVHSCTKRIRVVTSGNGSGKTALAANEVIWAATGYNPITKSYSPVPCRTVVVLDQPPKVANTWLPELRKWHPLRPEQLHKDGKPFVSRITFDNGSEILFVFHDQEPMSLESIELAFLVADEPMPRHVWIALLRGGRTKGRPMRALLVGTPIAGSWLREEIVDPWAKGDLPDVEVFRYGTKVNEANLAEGYIQQFSQFLTEKERRIRLEGEFADLDGLALAHLFKRPTHVLSALNYRWPPNWPVIVAIDPALAKPHVALMMGVTAQDQLVVLRELRLKGTAPQFATELKAWMEGYRVIDIVCDSMGSSDLTGGDGSLSFIAALNKAGVRARATSYAEKDAESWLNMIQQVLSLPEEADNLGKREPRLKVLDTCTGLIHDIETVAWEKYRLEDVYKPRLDIKKKDYLACLKYALAAQPAFDKGNGRVIRTERPAGQHSIPKAFKRGNIGLGSRRSKADEDDW